MDALLLLATPGDEVPLAPPGAGWYRRTMTVWLALVVLASPIQVDLPTGQIDWTDRTVSVLGVGTPKILSHTGGITPVDPLTAAKADARARIKALLNGLPVGSAQVASAVPALRDRFDKATSAGPMQAPRYFSDGTVHLPATATFAFPRAPRAVDPLAPTGLIIELSADIDPRLQIALVADGGAPILAGLPGQRVAPAGIIWVRGAVGYEHLKHVGPQPLQVKGVPGDQVGHIKLGADMQAVLAENSLGGILVVLP